MRLFLRSLAVVAMLAVAGFGAPVLASASADTPIVMPADSAAFNCAFHAQPSLKVFAETSTNCDQAFLTVAGVCLDTATPVEAGLTFPALPTAAARCAPSLFRSPPG